MARVFVSAVPARRETSRQLALGRSILFASLVWLAIALGWTADSDCSANQELKESPQVKQAVTFIRGLKDRRLFDLAQIYAGEQLDSELIDRVGRSAIVLERIRMKVAEAITLTDDQRKDAWTAAHEFAANFLTADPDHPRAVLVLVQDALTHLSHGTLIGQEVAAEIVTADAQAQALEQFRLATNKFRSTEKAIDELLPIQRNRSLTPQDLTPQQLVNLKNNLRYQMAVVNLAKAEMYDPADQLNQIDALNQVLRRLDEVLRQSNSDAPLWWKAQTSRAKCYRLMGQFDKSARVFENLPDAELTGELKTTILTEQILLAVASRQLGNRDKLLAAAADIGMSNAKLQLAVLRLLMESASMASGAEKKNWQQQATSFVTAIETDHGRYWGRRAEILIVGAIKPGAGDSAVASSDFEILVRQADSAFRKNNFNDAIKAYAKAAEFAGNNEDGPRAIATTVRLAQCHEQQKQFQAAAEHLLAVANRFSQAKNAAEVHLRGCWNWAQSAKDDKQRQEEFVKHLQQQIANWPESESTSQARIWLGNSYQSSSEWEQAVQTYLQVPIDSSKMLQAVQQVGPSANRWIAAAPSESEKEAVARNIAELLRTKLSMQDTASKSQWNEAERWLLLTWIDIGLPANALDAELALGLLEAASATITDEDRQWRQQAAARRIVAMTKSNADVATLTTRLQELPNDPGLMRVCLDGIDQSLTGREITNIAPLIAIICDKALVADAAGDQQVFWRLRRAVAALDLGQTESAVDDLKNLASENPKSMEIQLAYARGLSLQESDLQSAIGQWRRLAGKVKSGTEPWFEAKYNIALLLIKNNQNNEARQLLNYLQAIPPGWQQSSWKEKFDKLLVEVNR